MLEKHPDGLRITDLVESVDINRNTAGRYSENLLLSGQVEMRRFGMAKMYTLAKRLPVSSVLSLSSELVIQLDFASGFFTPMTRSSLLLTYPQRTCSGKISNLLHSPLFSRMYFPNLSNGSGMD